MSKGVSTSPIRRSAPPRGRYRKGMSSITLVPLWEKANGFSPPPKPRSNAGNSFNSAGSRRAGRRRRFAQERRSASSPAPPGLWWFNACRIVYVVNDDAPVRRFGFAYGTLPLHAGSGEERFLLELDRADGTVWYDVLAFSRPHSWLAKAGYLYLRRVQKQFGPASAAALAVRRER